MALAPTRLYGTKSMAPPLSPPGNATGLRLPSYRYALKSHLLLPAQVSTAPPATAPIFSMRVASKQAYIFVVIAVISTTTEHLSRRYLTATFCGAPKRRFRAYAPAVTKDANSTDVRKARKEQIKRDEGIGHALPFAIALGAAALIALYFYLNTTA